MNSNIRISRTQLTLKSFTRVVSFSWAVAGSLLFAALTSARPGHGGEAIGPPVVSISPISQSVFEESNISFQARAAGSQVSFGWQFNGKDIPGATNATLLLNNVQLSQAGAYRSAVRNPAGTAVSETATLAVRPFQPLRNWTLRHSATGGLASSTLRSVAFGSDLFVAVGDNGLTLSSSNGVRWVEGKNPSSTSLSSVAHGKGTFVAVGPQGSIVSSTNGIDWSPRADPTTLNLSGVTFANNAFFAVGGSRTTTLGGADISDLIILVSSNGVDWSVGLSQQGWGSLSEISYGKGVFVAVGSMHFAGQFGPSVYVLQSTSGQTWSRVRVNLSPVAYDRIQYGMGRFVALGRATQLATLTDPSDLTRSWITEDGRASGLFAPDSMHGLGFGREIFLVVGQDAVLASADGLTWRRQETGIPGTLRDVVFGQNTFVAVGDRGLVLQSADFPNSTLVFLWNPQLKYGAFQVSFQADEGREYVLEFKNRLDDPFWQQAASVVATGPVMQLSAPNQPNQQRFYRVRTR